LTHPPPARLPYHSPGLSHFRCQVSSCWAGTSGELQLRKALSSPAPTYNASCIPTTRKTTHAQVRMGVPDTGGGLGSGRRPARPVLEAEGHRERHGLRRVEPPQRPLPAVRRLPPLHPRDPSRRQGCLQSRAAAGAAFPPNPTPSLPSQHAMPN